MTVTRPPRYADRLLRQMLDAAAYEAVDGDLEEDFHRHTTHGLTRARVRYWDRRCDADGVQTAAWTG
jgi:hypothetical protein